ncbi:MAG: cupin domain-containing protein [Bacteroidetes bacterium]|nr:cupin domain-containing protein [Bacteroidota bacterium]
MNESEIIIEKLGLLPHPEGGYFKEVYRSAEEVAQSALPNRYKGSRSFATSIYFMLGANDISHLHKVKSDETWHFYKGQAINLMYLDGESLKSVIIGNDLNAGQTLQFTVKANTWFAAELVNKEEGSYGLVGCSVYPGFDFADFVLAKIQDFFTHESDIARTHRHLFIG